MARLTSIDRTRRGRDRFVNAADQFMRPLFAERLLFGVFDGLQNARCCRHDERFPASHRLVRLRSRLGRVPMPEDFFRPQKIKRARSDDGLRTNRNRRERLAGQSLAEQFRRDDTVGDRKQG